MRLESSKGRWYSLNPQLRTSDKEADLDSKLHADLLRRCSEPFATNLLGPTETGRDLARYKSAQMKAPEAIPTIV